MQDSYNVYKNSLIPWRFAFRVDIYADLRSRNENYRLCIELSLLPLLSGALIRPSHITAE